MEYLNEVLPICVPLISLSITSLFISAAIYVAIKVLKIIENIF